MAAAERTIEAEGLRGLRARTLAEEVGCAVGAIYNAVEDLDELVLLVNTRTLARAGTRSERCRRGVGSATRVGPIARSHAWCAWRLPISISLPQTTQRWRALFDHRMPPGHHVPDWYRKEQQRLFDYVEEPLRELQPNASPKRRALLARSLFSAVHGLVALGLEEKLQAIPLPALREQITFIVTTIGRGMTTAE